jgi:23S rRNA-/tRNA-specific pseudouridylate synthase
MKWQAARSEKLIAFLQAQLGGAYSGKQLRKALEANLCRVNTRVERFGSASIKAGDTVELAAAWKSLLPKKPAPIETIYEDEHLTIINKPAGWVSADTQSSRLVHRLDKDTTGLLILAKSSHAFEKMKELFEKKEIVKEYLALVDGHIFQQEGRIENRLAKKGSFQGQTIWGSSPTGSTAITDWKALAKGKNSTLLLCKPLTGRTHQIRVHLSEMNHPILVDRQYAKSFRCKHFIQRPLLHAHKLRFTHPFFNKEIDLEAPIPQDFQEVLKLEHISLGF